MKVLITGVSGFVGGYLSEYLLEQGHQVWGTILPGEDTSHLDSRVVLQVLDITNKENMQQCIQDIQPNHIYHLAGQSNVFASWKAPAMTMEINVIGTINLLEAIRDTDVKARILIIGSSEQYGMVLPEDCPIGESFVPNPHNPYASSKMAQEQIALQFVKAYGQDVVLVRAFNHIGPKQSKSFVVPDFASKIVDIERGSKPVLYVGNLEAYRDFTDVRDIVRGYDLLMQKGRTGEIYNIGSGKACPIKEILSRLLSLTTAEIAIEVDENRLRPSDLPIIYCDNKKIKKDTGWEPIYDITETLEDTLNHWRRM